MNNKYLKVNEILKKYNQEHLLSFFDLLDKEEKNTLLEEILETDFEQIQLLYENSIKQEKIDDVITPLEHIEKKQLSFDEIKKYSQIGIEVLKKNKLAVVTMAGGQGSRLGFKGPKGTFKLEQPIDKSLFEIKCEELIRTNKTYKSNILWCIMTSVDNDKETRDFFKKNNYFKYPKNRIKFFVQDTIPLIDVNGKIMLQECYKIKKVSNGNGNVFIALQKHKILDKFKKEKISWVSFGGIDNVLSKDVDPLFIGLTINKGTVVATKTVFKEQALEKEAVFCRRNNKPSILYYNEIDLELSESKDLNGNYLYREANIISHLMSLEAVEKATKSNLPYHRSFKKNVFINDEAMKEVPIEPNSFKFENFIFDVFSDFDDMLLLRVDKKDEFSPIKDFNGPNNPEVAKDMYINYWNNQLKEL